MMKKFRFTLQSVLDVKRALEKQQMGELAACNARIRAFEKKRLEQIERECAQHEEFKRQLEDGISPAELKLWREANLTARERVEYQEKVLEQAEGERLRIEKKLVGLMQERKILERLREKQWENYRAEERRAAASELAEFMGHSVFNDREGIVDGGG
jgi:flagellar FliJ protein